MYISERVTVVHKTTPRVITVITTSLPHRADPVAGCFVAELCKALAQRGHRVTVVFVSKGARDVVLPIEGVTLRAVHCALHPFYGEGAPERLRARPGAWLGALLTTKKLLCEARKLRTETEGWVSHFIVPCGAIAAWLSGGARHLAVVHGSDAVMFSRAPRWFRQWVLSRSTWVWCSHSALVSRVGASVERTIVRPMGYWRAREPITGVNGTSTEISPTVMVLVVARLVALKGVDRVARAVESLRHGGRDVTLVVAGDGPERRVLERGFGWVTWLGAVTPTVRDALMAKATVLVHAPRVLPSGETDGAPTVLVEAMAAGLAVVATAVGGVNELVGDAAIVLPGDASDGALAEAIARVIDDPLLRENLRARGVARASPWEWNSQAEAVERALFGE